MLHAGLDLSRHRLDVHLLDAQGSTVQVTTVPPDADGLRGLVRQTGTHGQPVRAAIESMNGARFVHDQLELAGWLVAIADAQKVKGLAPLACKTDRIDAWVLAELPPRPSPRDLAAHPRGSGRAGTRPMAAASGPPPDRAQEPHPRHPAGLRQALSGRRPVRCRWPPAVGPPDPSRAVGRERGRGPGAYRRPGRPDRRLRTGPAAPRRRPPLCAAAQDSPGIAWVLGYTIAAELGDIARFPSAKKLCGYTGLCPRVYQSGSRDQRGPLAKNGPPYLRWALIEAAIHAAHHPCYRDRYQRTKQRLGRQRGARVARVEFARKLTEAIWYMLTRQQPFAPARPPTSALVA